MPEGRGSVPEGRSDRSLARSAWNSPTPKEPSRRARYDRAQTRLLPADSDGSGLRAVGAATDDLVPEVFRVEGRRVF
jgi:hypothetical protein